jgi:hypothetical protein
MVIKYSDHLDDAIRVDLIASMGAAALRARAPSVGDGLLLAPPEKLPLDLASATVLSVLRTGSM